jgi:hypothetical protein
MRHVLDSVLMSVSFSFSFSQMMIIVMILIVIPRLPSTLSWLEVVNLKEREKSESRLRVISYFSPIVNEEWQTGCSFSRCFSLKRTNELFCFKSSSSLSHIRIEGKSERESMNHIHSPPELLIHILRCVVFEKGDKEKELRHYHH